MSGVSRTTFEEALQAVKAMKEKYGTGASTMLILENQTPYHLNYRETTAVHGKWENKPPQKIPSGLYGAFFYVKQSGSLKGTQATAQFAIGDPSDGDTQTCGYLGIGWNTPLSGANTVGVELSTTPVDIDPDVLTLGPQHCSLVYEGGKLHAFADVLENNATGLDFFRVSN